MSGDDEVRYDALFRQRWRDRRSVGARSGELIKQPGWIDAGLVALSVLLVGGAVAAGTITIARTAALPAIAQGNTITAVRSGGVAPAPGTAVQFRETSGSMLDAVVVAVSATEVQAELRQPGPPEAGQLLIPAGRQPLISALLPSLG